MSNLLNEGGHGNQPRTCCQRVGRTSSITQQFIKNKTAMSVAGNMFTLFELAIAYFFDGWGWPTINERYQEIKMLCNFRL